jgi:hypothetical protein
MSIPLFWNWIHVHGLNLLIVHNKGQCFIGIIQICHPFQVDVFMGVIQQTPKCLQLINRKWKTIIVQGIKLPLVDLYGNNQITNENVLLLCKLHKRINAF